MIKAIDTLYAGNYFRSRLEARWAVFFDAAGIEYEYEPKGFVLEDDSCYLPDFYLPSLGIYCEVKPDLGGAFYLNGQPNWNAIANHVDFLKWQLFTNSPPTMLAVLFGNPSNKPFWVLCLGAEDNGQYLFYLETKKKNKTEGEVFPYWRLWGASGDEINEDLDPFIDTAIKKIFEHKQK